MALRFVFIVLFILARLVTLLIGMSEAIELRTIFVLLIAPGFTEWALHSLLVRRFSKKTPPIFPRTIGNLAYALLIIIDLRVLTAFHRPLDLSLFSEGISAMPIETMLRLLRWHDWLFIAIALLTPLAKIPLRLPLFAKNAYALSALLFSWGTAFALPEMVPGYTAISPVLRLPALAIFHTAQNFTTALTASQKTLFDPLPGDVPRALHSERKDMPNILFIVLESTGMRYVFDPELALPSKGVPMPFMHKLKSESLFLARHHATANSSPRALFSLFTGLYPEPVDEFFSLKRSLKIKTWNRYLPPHRALVVTPCFVEWYFPLGLFRNNGITEIIGRNQLHFRENWTAPAEARNEIQTADYFAARLKEIDEPFFAVYISFAPHYPYHDYGPAWHIARGDSRLSHYVNNLRLLDEQLKKFFTALESRRVLRNTVVVIVGDHGEAFEQHPGNYIHSLYSYEENLWVPALIWYPEKLQPREVTRLTSHVDIGPTLLDLLQIPHRPRDFQGISVLRNYGRRFTFAYGNEGTITVYGEEADKLQRLRDGSCRVFALDFDPQEKNPLPCAAQSLPFKLASGYAAGQMALLKSAAQKPD